MKVLVTGAAGQVGRALATTAPADIEVLALGRAAFDLKDGAAIAEKLAQACPDWVINCAAYTAVDQAEAEYAAALAVNGEAVEQLAAACARLGIRLAQLSTDFVFAGDRASAYRPEDPPHPCNAYGLSKLAGEKAALSLDGALVVRTAWVYAAQGMNFVNTMLRLMRERDEVGVVDDQIGTPTHAASLARTVWNLVRSGASGIWHATDAGVASWYDFAVAIQDEAAQRGLIERRVPVRPISTVEFPTPARRPAFSVLDKQATWQRTGPAPHWRHELGAMLDEVRQAAHG